MPPNDNEKMKRYETDIVTRIVSFIKSQDEDKRRTRKNRIVEDFLDGETDLRFNKGNAT